ncbi:hypothetical protein J2W49_000618 [Hydrogenophaga palleronii]|uniref:Uncharacterized protein n=1 Tax=Hydrogenophaga palleronii TaxID=65655 RepID=A0ABU1WHE5_9BURK|nr:hypothetical protein [Hydrogenophaga palleronii]MDR7148690.1 hypothetical protein [Hydrogenophaga palleronii]
MTYSLKLFVPDDTTPAQREAAERRFRDALEGALGDASLVAPVYSAYLRIAAVHGEDPGADALSDGERLVFDQWQAAEAAAMEAVFGPHRHMGEGLVEIRLQA